MLWHYIGTLVPAPANPPWVPGHGQASLPNRSAEKNVLSFKQRLNAWSQAAEALLGMEENHTW